MKNLVLLSLVCLYGCTSKPPKSCYELTLSFNGVNSKQILCTDKPLKESYNFKLVENPHVLHKLPNSSNTVSN